MPGVTTFRHSHLCGGIQVHVGILYHAMNRRQKSRADKRFGCGSRCVLKGSDDDVEGRQHDRAVPVMEVGPPGSPCRRGSQTTAVSCRSRAGVGSDCGEGPQSAGQVCDEKTNMCKPLLTHRNHPKLASKPGVRELPGTKARPYGVSSARRRPACCPGGARCKGGVSSSRALAWNRRTCRLDTDGQSKWVRSAPWSQEGGPQAAETVSGRVPMRGTGAGRLVIAMKAL
jgi:hypothetical protein